MSPSWDLWVEKYCGLLGSVLVFLRSASLVVGLYLKD